MAILDSPEESNFEWEENENREERMS